MDLVSAYYQVRMREEDIKYTVFQAPNGFWEYLVLPMGVCKAPATMHRLTSKLFRGLENTKSFFDDIYVCTKCNNIEDYLKALHKTLDILRDNKIYDKLAKYVFCEKEIPCLGDFDGRDGVRTDPDKVQTIKDWQVPRTQEELHNFLGLTGYVQRFCPEYALLTATMLALLKKQDKRNAKIHFNDEQLNNFKELKWRLCNPPTLHFLDFTQPMHLGTDASKFAVGGVLFNVVDGVERPIAYTSRKMKSAELNYPTQQQDSWRSFMHLPLSGSTAWTNHQSWRQTTRALKPTFSYLSGARNGIADALSRRADLQPGTKLFHDLSVTSFDDTSFSLAISDVVMDSEIIPKIKKAHTKDKEVKTIFAAIERRTSMVKPKERRQHRKLYRYYSEANGLLWYQSPADDNPRIVVPNDVKLKQAIIGEYHNSNCGGHPGTERTYVTLARRWYWSKMLKWIQKFIVDCEPCRWNKPRLTKPPGLLEPLSIPDERWRPISMAFSTDLPQTKREINSIWVVIDRLTMRCHFVPTTKSATAESVARLFIDHIWKFVSTFWQHVFKSVGTKLNMTIAYRAHGDGQTEQMNRTLEEYLCCYVGPLQGAWGVHLANAEFAINSSHRTLRLIFSILSVLVTLSATSGPSFTDVVDRFPASPAPSSKGSS